MSQKIKVDIVRKDTNAKPIKYLKVTDDDDKYRIYRSRTPSLPMRVNITGKSMLAGKTNLLINWLGRPYDHTDESGMEFYRKHFKPENIHIISPSIHSDKKWHAAIDALEIPPENLFDSYAEGSLRGLVDKLKAEHLVEPKHTLIVLDDCSFGGSLKEKLNGVLSELACNGRHYLISYIVTAQKHSDIPTTLREQATYMLVGRCSNKQAELIADDVVGIPKKAFLKMLDDTTQEPHHFLVICGEPYKPQFMTHEFDPINIT